MRISRLGVFGLLAGALAAGCTVSETAAPPLSGPSELALSLSAQALPDAISHDGASQASVVIDARGPNSQPVRGVTLRAQTFVDGQPVDFGTLSSKTVVTGDDGRARLTYTAPPAPWESVGWGTTVTVAFTPIGSDYRGETFRQVDILLFPPGKVIPPAGAPPTVAFTFSPTTVTTYLPIIFDASPTVCRTQCTFSWTFGDGGSGTGRTATHEFRAPGSYVVTLTATDSRGQSASLSQSVTVAASTAPTAAFSFSPTTPGVSQDIFFTAEASRPAAGRRIVSYDWNFGSGRTGNGVTVSKRYDTAGTYVVTLTVTDDANQQGTVSVTIPVGQPPPTTPPG